MNICLIGASGFIGTRLIDLLKQQQNWHLLNIDKKNSYLHPEITVITDIRDKENLKSLLNGQDIVILLAAEHRDDVYPISLYYDVNVEGTKNVLETMDIYGINKIIFTSSVAVYGLNKSNPNEDSPVEPFNHYGKSKWEAEKILLEWYNKNKNGKTLTIIRPTVVFGERNRGNVYNLLYQISSGKFLKIGKCNNKKSMAYVGNIVSFILYLIDHAQGYNIYNYVDKPDLSMNELINVVSKSLDRKIPSIKIPYVFGILGGYFFDLFSWITGKKLHINSIRVKKFCATTQFDSSKVSLLGFQPPYSLLDGLDRTLKFEFQNERDDNLIYESE